VTELRRELLPIAAYMDGACSGSPDASVLDATLNAQADGRAADPGQMLCETFTPPDRLIVFGGGHICLPLVQFASRTGFRVTVIDDRPEFANHKRFPEADLVVCKPFSEVLKGLQLSPYDYVCILTRGHHSDGVCLRGLYVLPRPAYIGMIGSRRRVRSQFDLLEKEGIAREWLDTIHTPIGLDIGAVTPAEIAVSILSELIMCRRNPDADRHIPDNRSDVEEDVLHFLSKDCKPHAIVTIIGAEGSTPRSVGARMSVTPDGRITGTIGGGYAEGLFIEEAKNIIGTGRFMVRSIDLNGNVAAADGMACGGRLKVLVEDSVPGI
jgi:xanthine dehydrogenase accessory factor